MTGVEVRDRTEHGRFPRRRGAWRSASTFWLLGVVVVASGAVALVLARSGAPGGALPSALQVGSGTVPAASSAPVHPAAGTAASSVPGTTVPPRAPESTTTTTAATPSTTTPTTEPASTVPATTAPPTTLAPSRDSAATAAAPTTTTSTTAPPRDSNVTTVTTRQPVTDDDGRTHGGRPSNGTVADN